MVQLAVLNYNKWWCTNGGGTTTGYNISMENGKLDTLNTVGLTEGTYVVW
jgi:hypothetical protein